MSETVKKQILAIRDTGLTNMFDVRTVQRIANDMEILRAGGVSGGASIQIRAFHSHRRSVNYTIPAAKFAVKIV